MVQPTTSVADRDVVAYLRITDVGGVIHRISTVIVSL